MSASDAEPLLADLLRRTLCPTPQQTLFLRACLNGDLDAWDQWSRLVGDPKTELGSDTIGIKRLVPLLYTSLKGSGAHLDADFLSYLRAAYVREDLRSRTFRRVCAEALGALSKANVSFLVLPGVSLAESAYSTWALRHCHDVDLWVKNDELPEAISALAGFQIYSRDKTNVNMVPTAHLPVVLHTQLFEHYQSAPTYWTQGTTSTITGVDVRSLAPHHELAHICVHAVSNSSRRMFLWVADAFHLLQQSPTLDWQSFLGDSRHIALPTYVMLSYLRESMGAAIPLDVLQSLKEGANQKRGAALQGVVTTTGYRGLIREARTAQERVLVWSWIAGQSTKLRRRSIR